MSGPTISIKSIQNSTFDPPTCSWLSTLCSWVLDITGYNWTQFRWSKLDNLPLRKSVWMSSDSVLIFTFLRRKRQTPKSINPKNNQQNSPSWNLNSCSIALICVVCVVFCLSFDRLSLQMFLFATLSNFSRIFSKTSLLVPFLSYSEVKDFSRLSPRMLNL